MSGNVFIVAMGISWSGRQNDIVVFDTLKKAMDYVAEQFESDIKDLKNHDVDDEVMFGLKIGNTFEIKSVRKV